jgi:hypothetical protein
MLSIEETTQQLWLASERQRACRVVLEGEPLPRIVLPLGIARTSKNHIVLVCWQTAGFTRAGGKEGYRNLQLDKVKEIEELHTHFHKPNDFNPLDGQYLEWVYHI